MRSGFRSMSRRPMVERLEDRCLLSAYLVRDITAGANSSTITLLSAANDRAVFRLNPLGNITNPWGSDGTADGTSQLIPNNLGHFIPELRVANGLGYFVRNFRPPGQPPRINSSLFRTDGTPQGTARFEGGGDFRYYENLTPVADGLFYTLSFNGGTRSLWKTDGLSQTQVATGLSARNHTGVGRNLFFTVGDDLWTSDGTAQGTVRVTTVPSPADLTDVNGTLYFTAADPATGRELWTSDGTAEGTRLVADVRPGPAGSNPGQLVEWDGWVGFTADDGLHGRELWASNGDPKFTYLVSDINPGDAGSDPGQLRSFGATLFFAATHPDSGRELWASGGLEHNTSLVKDLVPGPDGAQPGGLTNWDGYLVFTADDAKTGRELWFSDGTEDGTFLLEDIRPGSVGSAPNLLTPAGSRLFFTADDGVSGRELWAYAFDRGPGRDGAPGGPHAVIEAQSAVSAATVLDRAAPRRESTVSPVAAAVPSPREQIDRLFAVTTEATLALPQEVERELARLTTRHASLEDVFVTLTGRHLRDEEPASPA